MSRRRTRGWRRVAFAGLAALLGLAGLEGLARLVPLPGDQPPQLQGTPERYPAHCTADADLGWVPTPGATGDDPIWRAWARSQGLPEEAGAVKNNALGMRDDPVGDRQSGVARVLALGDSSLWGSGVRPERRFTELLEAALPVDVLNAGVSGYSTWQARAWQERLAELQPDGVLLYLMNSDMNEARAGTDDAWFSSRWRRQGTAGLQWSALAAVLRLGVERMRPPNRPTPRVHVRHYADNLRALVEAAAPAAVVAVLPPTVEDLRAEPGRYWPADAAEAQAWRRDQAGFSLRPAWDVEQPVAYRRALVLTLEEAGVPIVDGPAVVRAAAAQDSGPWFVDAVHPTEAGHAVLAEAMAPVLQAALERGAGGAAPR